MPPPPFLGFSIQLGPYFIPQHNLQKKSVRLYHILFNRFKAFCINFSLIFDQIDPLFFIDFKSFRPLIFTKH